MIYSCFNQDTGTYRYFEDAATHPINGDLPVPKLPAKSGRIGVAALDAARTLPSAAKPAGTGWHARGMVVRCPKGGLRGLGESLSRESHGVILLGAAAFMLLLLSSSKEWS